MKKTKFVKYKEIIDLFEDYITDGYKKAHESPPEIIIADENPNRAELLNKIYEDVKKCEKCGLSKKRTNTVPGIGVLFPDVFIIGEAPGAEEDKKGEPFVGRAGQYLDKWLEAIGISRSTNCYIGNIIKCRPPGNRDPLPEEKEACLMYLEKQIDILKPKVILTPGRISSQIIMGTDIGIGRLRGKVYKYKGIPVIPTYHPSAVLRNPSLKRSVWDDLKILKSMLNNG